MCDMKVYYQLGTILAVTDCSLNSMTAHPLDAILILQARDVIVLLIHVYVMCALLTWKLGLIVVNGDDEAVVRQQEANTAQQQ